jgi:hypothetical protein
VRHVLYMLCVMQQCIQAIYVIAAVRSSFKHRTAACHASQVLLSICNAVIRVLTGCHYYYCYCVLSQVKRLSPDQYKATPSGDTFVNSTVRRGVLPVILDELLAARKVSTYPHISDMIVHLL